MRVFVCFFAFFGAKIWPAAADTGELGWDLRDPTRHAMDHYHVQPTALQPPYERLRA